MYEAENTLLLSLLNDKTFDMPCLKTCPWCGHDGVLKCDSLGKPNGRGYPGHFLFYVECSNDVCSAIAPYGKVDDLYRSTKEAITKAVKIWNTREE